MTIPYEKDPGGSWTWGRVLTSFRRRGVVDPVVNDAAFQRQSQTACASWMMICLRVACFSSL